MEMSDDLGDSHIASLHQGGKLPLTVENAMLVKFTHLPNKI